MPNIGAVLREEITRLARKESRSQVDPTKKAALQHRHDIAALKRQVATLERQLALVSRKLLSGPPAATPSARASGKQVRFVAKGLRTHRERLGLSQANLAKLLGVSTQSIYNWENEVSRPRAEQVARIAAMRGLGKREAAARLQQAPGARG